MPGGLVSGEATGHDDDHGPLDHGGMVGGQSLVVAYDPPASADPREGPLHDPPSGQRHEPDLTSEFADDVDGQPEPCGGPGDELTGVAVVGPHLADRGERGAQRPEQGPGG